MKVPKAGRPRPWGGQGVHFSRGHSSKVQWKGVAPLLFGVFLFMVFLGPGDISDLLAPSVQEGSVEVVAYETTITTSRSLLGPLSLRNTSFSFKPKVASWDFQRNSWLNANKNRTGGDGRRRVMLVTGSQSAPCESPIETHMLLKIARNKIHYCRLHGMHMYYNLAEPHTEFTGSWAKLPVLRMLMLAHPEVEWFWWIDSDAVITDMKLELPLHKYDGHNFVIYGNEHSVHNLKDWTGLLTGNFLIRNCEWSLRLLDAWGSMGPVGSREEVGGFLSDALNGRPHGREADDQSALVYLVTTEKQLWTPMLLLEKDPFFTGVWTEVTGKLEEMEFYPSGDSRLPMVTQFSGCSQCCGNLVEWPWEDCQREMQRALDFADNQMYEKFGYKLSKLGTEDLVHIPGHVLETVVASAEEPLGEFLGFPIHKLPGPHVTNWDEQRLEWFEKNPAVKRTSERGRPKTMMVTGSSFSECNHPVGGHLLLKGLKNKIDYAHFHDMNLYYGMLDFDPEMTYWWTKIPTIRLLMVTHPEVEWFWWCDSDAVVTDMAFQVPFENFNDKNFILYGDETLVEARDWIAVNAGVYLIRNCQWSLDFLAIWGSVGTKSVHTAAGEIQTKMLVGRGPWGADDQSALIVMLMIDSEKKWAPKIALERNFAISGYWRAITNRFEEMQLKSHPGLGNMDWPWITHFAGCQPCGTKKGNFDLSECLTEMERTFNFADNQILHVYGFLHSNLGSDAVNYLSI